MRNLYCYRYLFEDLRDMSESEYVSVTDFLAQTYLCFKLCKEVAIINSTLTVYTKENK